MTKALLVDLGGVVYTGETLVPGAAAAIRRLRDAGYALRFATNVTRQPRRLLVHKLRALGVDIIPQEVHMPGIAARNYLAARGLTPYLLVDPALREDFADLPEGEANAVVVGDARDGFTYDNLNQAFRLLTKGAPLLALAGNRYYRDADGELSLDAGAFIKALTYASGVEAVMLGKPAPGFFMAALASMNCAPADALMVGDDAEFDVAAAISIGLQGILVRTGKYESGAEDQVNPRPTLVLDDLGAAADWLLAQA